MSYYATFEPTQEAMDKVKEKDPLQHYLSTDPNTFLQEAKFTLLHLAMKNPENASVKTALFQIFQDTYHQIRLPEQLHCGTPPL